MEASDGGVEERGGGNLPSTYQKFITSLMVMSGVVYIHAGKS